MSTTRRMNRIFQSDGKALIVALDHGLLDGSCLGMENPVETISKIVASGAGVAIGRNIFQADDPVTIMTAAIAAILHQGASVDEAMTILEKRL